jgi:predicted nucleotidyltransferase
VATLASAALSPAERRTLERLTRLIEDQFGDDLHGVWLYGSRARGEQTHDESDIDLLVVATPRGPDDDLLLIRLRDQAAEAEGVGPDWFSIMLYEPERVAERREIRSFFMQEVDRDKIVLAGKP